MENKHNAFRIPCKVEDFIPSKLGSGVTELQQYVVDLWGLRDVLNKPDSNLIVEDKPNIILPEALKQERGIQADPRATVMSGECKGKVFVVDGHRIKENQCLLEFEDGMKYMLIPHFVVVGEIVNS
ncbi:MAG: hypothetical protein ACRCXN_08385 [Bacteroidales bacterium]